MEWARAKVLDGVGRRLGVDSDTPLSELSMTNGELTQVLVPIFGEDVEVVISPECTLEELVAQLLPL